MTSVQDEPASPPEPVHRDLEETNTATQRARLPRVVGGTQVGVGGMGQVYAAYDPRLDRRVALKLLHTRGTKAERERLVRELFDRAHWCLDKRRLELTTLVAELADADDEGVQNTIASAAE